MSTQTSCVASGITPPPEAPTVAPQIFCLSSIARLRTGNILEDIIYGASEREYATFIRELLLPTGILHHLEDTLRYLYNPIDQTLHLEGMSTSLHDSIGKFVTTNLRDAILRSSIFDDSERKAIRFLPDSEVQLPGSFTSHQKSRTGPTKKPDASIEVRRVGQRILLPRIVFKVGSTQDDNSLREDAFEYLVASRGFVRKVFLVKIDEGALPKLEADGAEVEVEEVDVDELVVHGDSQESTVETLSRQLDQIDPDDWVGPLTVSIEVWEFSEPRDIRQVGTKVYLLNGPRGKPTLQDNPVYISKEDLFPGTSAAEQKVQIPLESYVELLEEARVHLALKRSALPRFRLRTHDNVYVDPEPNRLVADSPTRKRTRPTAAL